jgi:hypothetical protein
MTALSEVVGHVQNPALGAVLEWQFVVGYSDERGDASGCPLPLLFIVLPLVLHRDSLEHIDSTLRKSGLLAFASKFSISDNNESDILLSVHERVSTMRGLSLRSLRVALGAHLLTVDPSDGTAYGLSKTLPRAGITERSRVLLRNARKLGDWCGALTVFEIASILRIRF